MSLSRYCRHTVPTQSNQCATNYIDIALHHDVSGDPVTVVTKKNEKSDWFLTGDIWVRFPSKRSVLTAYAQQRAPLKHKGESDSRSLTHDRHISPKIIPTGHIGNESSEASLHKIFVSCELLRGQIQR